MYGTRGTKAASGDTRNMAGLAKLPCAISLLRQRGLLSATTSDNLAEALSTILSEYRSNTPNAADGAQKAPPSVYVGFDPTASSLHVGNLVSVRALEIFQAAGFRPIALVGGATGLIGDPSGKSADRNLLNVNQVKENQTGIEKSLKQVLNFECPGVHQVKMVNNIDWYNEMSAFEFVRDIGKHFRLSHMLSKDSVKNRLESDVGISFTEFSYQMFQAHDFYHLHTQENCVLQLGGSDQWGNIVAGCDLIRRRNNENKVYGLTVPLMTTSSGEKLGKSAGNAIWIDPDKTSPYDFYQYFMQIKDEDILELLPMMGVHVQFDQSGERVDDDGAQHFSLAKAMDIIELHKKDPGKRYAQRFLADSMTTWVHGEDECKNVQQVTKQLFQRGAKGGGISMKDTLDAALKSGTVTKVAKEKLPGMKIVDLGIECNAIKTKGEGKRLIKNGGLYLNDIRVAEANDTVDTEEHVVEDKYIVMRVGRKSCYIIQVC